MDVIDKNALMMSCVLLVLLNINCVLKVWVNIGCILYT